MSKARSISGIYNSVPKIGGKKPLIGRPSDVPYSGSKSDVIAQGDVYTKDGMLRMQKIHKGEYGCFIRIGGHEVKVISLGDNAWTQKGIDLANLPMVYHPRELASVESTPVKIYSDFTRYAPVKHGVYRQKNLKCETRDLVEPQYVETHANNFVPQYRKSAEHSKSAGQSESEKAKITALAGITPELLAWEKTIGK